MMHKLLRYGVKCFRSASSNAYTKDIAHVMYLGYNEDVKDNILLINSSVIYAEYAKIQDILILFHTLKY